MNGWWRLALAGLAAFLVFLVLSAPAAKLLPYFQPQLPGVQFSGVSGSLWSGQALRVDAGAMQLSKVHWRLRLLALFKGALEFSIDADYGGQPLVGRAGIGLFSGPYAADVVGRLAASDLLYGTGMSAIVLDGQLDFAIDDIAGIGSGVPTVAGAVSWSPARVLSPIELDLGQAQLVTRIESGVTRGKVSASGGVLAVSGDLTVNPDGNYTLVAEIQKKGSVPQAVDKFLATFAEFRNGNYRLEWSDQIKH
jgi:general secretion pathway protein N